MILFLFIHCKSDNTKTFYFKSVGWKISVPVSMTIRDSATIYKPLPEAKQTSPAIPNDSVVYDEPSPRKENLNFTTPLPVYTPIDNPEKLLLQVTETGKWRLNSSSLSAGIKPVTKEKSREEGLRSMRTELAGAYTRDYLPKTTVDTVFSKESVGGKLFDKSQFTYTGANSTQNIVVYSRIINGYEFNCAISYYDPAIGKLFMDIFKKSKFD